jgi:hypothetical protein
MLLNPEDYPHQYIRYMLGISSIIVGIKVTIPIIKKNDNRILH